MTTIKDLLNDFLEETIELYQKYENIREVTQEDIENMHEAKELLIDEYINIIKERIVG